MKLVQQLRELRRKAGMHPRKLLSNSKSFGRNRYKGETKQIDLSMNDLPSLRIWGVMVNFIRSILLYGSFPS